MPTIAAAAGAVLVGALAITLRVLQIVLETHFAWHDIPRYVVGAGLATLVHANARASSRCDRMGSVASMR